MDGYTPEYLSARCPACGNRNDYCQGHGMIGDPWGNDVLWDHDHGIHDRCHANADCED